MTKMLTVASRGSHLGSGRVIPLRDENPTSRTAWVTVVLILLNVGIYFLVQPGSTEVAATARFSYEHAAVPCEVTTGEPLSLDEIRPALEGRSDTHCTSDSPLPPVFPHKHVFLAVLSSMFF